MTITLHLLRSFCRKKDQYHIDIFRICIAISMLLFSISATYGQTVVGMGTESPNPNSVLELVSNNRNQGLLVPRLSSQDIISLAKKLSQKDNGLLVFVEDEGKFFYWWDNNWRKLEPDSSDKVVETIQHEQLKYKAGAGIDINENVITNIGDKDSTNELQNIASVLKLGTDANGYRISNIADPLDDQDAATRKFVLNQMALTAPPTLVYDNISHSLSIDGSNTIELGSSLINTDSQNLSSIKSSSYVSISISGGNTTTFSVADQDNDVNNEIQDLTLIGNILKVNKNTLASSINLSPYLDNTDAQTLSLTGSQLNITNGNSVDLSSLSGVAYTAGAGIGISGSNVIANTAPDQTVNLNGSGAVSVSGTYPNFTISATDNVDDADANPSNEIQDLSLSTNTLKITNNPTATSVDLNPYLDNKDEQTLTTTGTSLIISNGNTVNLGGLVNATTLAEGNIWVGNNTNKAIPLDASSDAQILVGKGTTVASVSIIGDLVLQSDGTLSLKNTVVTTNKIDDGAVTSAKLASNAVTEVKIADDAVSRDKINVNVAGTGLMQAANGSLQTTNTTSGEILIGQGGTVSSRSISGDLSLAADGSTNIAKLQGKNVNANNPSNGEVLTWNGTAWTSAPASAGGDKQWYEGINAPTSGNPSGASDGDYYYDTDDNIVYRKVSGSWTSIGGYNIAPSAPINMGTRADAYRTPILYTGDDKPEEGDDIGSVGDFYYSRNEEKMYYRVLDVSNGKIKWIEI